MGEQFALVSRFLCPPIRGGLWFEGMKHAAVSSLALAMALGLAACRPQSVKPRSNVTTNATTAAHAHTNRLAREKSPYLLQHQFNPVDWYAWGDDAFTKARKENKPIF